MHAAHYSSLLPDVFRHKTTKVRVPQPKVVLLDFHGTISERRWEDKVIYPYVKQAVDGYLQSNWDNDTIQRCLPGLRNESFEQRFRNKFDDAPVIDEPVDGEEDRVGPKQLASQMSDFLIWQMNSKKETRETQIIERLVWQDGLRRKKILTPIYDDVMPCLREWHDKYKCPIYIIASLESDTLRLLFRNTTKGNLDAYLSDYVSTKSGDKLVSDVYAKFYERFKSSFGLKAGGSPGNHQAPTVANSPPMVARSVDNHTASQVSDKSLSLRSAVKSPRTASSFDGLARPILFLTDSGQEAKAASQVADGLAFECLLVNRPGNKRIRTYYLSQFQYIEKFDDIEFVK